MQLSQIIYAFIPKYIGNGIVTGVWNLMRRMQRLSAQRFPEHLAENEKAFETHIEAIRKNSGYIEDQRSYSDMAYGRTTMQYAGCAVFAAYNAVYHVTGKNDISLPEMIAEFERDGMARFGLWGTAPKAVRDFLNRQGFQTVMATNRRKFTKIDRMSKSLILTMYNNGSDIRAQLHTIQISKENGLYTAHNVYCDGQTVGPCDNLSELLAKIHDGRAKGVALIGIL